MKVRVRKITNISESSVAVNIDPSTSIYLLPGQSLENRDVYNLDTIRPFVSVEQDLAEINPIHEGTQPLFD
jgi:hypothetical protein